VGVEGGFLGELGAGAALVEVEGEREPESPLAEVLGGWVDWEGQFFELCELGVVVGFEEGRAGLAATLQHILEWFELQHFFQINDIILLINSTVIIS
jgi:hypothetical protein